MEESATAAFVKVWNVEFHANVLWSQYKDIAQQVVIIISFVGINGTCLFLEIFHFKLNMQNLKYIFKQEFYTRQIKIQMLYANNTHSFAVHVSAMFRNFS